MTQSPATSQAAANWDGRTVLVTGAEGFIGSTLVDRLVEHGARVRAFVHYKPYAERGNLAKYLGDPDSPVTVRAGDLRDGGQLIDAVAGCDTVFHLGALMAFPYSYEAPDSYVQTNVCGTLNVAEACRRTMHASSTRRRVRLTGPRVVPIPKPTRCSRSPVLCIEDRCRHDGAVLLARL
jgi:nucleoside-diphosphate-sugar epimerase